MTIIDLPTWIRSIAPSINVTFTQGLEFFMAMLFTIMILQILSDLIDKLF